MAPGTRRSASGSLIALLTVYLPTVSSANVQTSDSVYPHGTAFPLQLYELQPDSEIPFVTPNGWNIGQRYGWADGGGGVDALNQLMQLFSQNGIHGLPALPAIITVEGSACTSPPHCRSGWREADLADWIVALAPNTNVAYWDLPEELRYFRPAEFAIVQNYSTWTRAYDPQLRPNFMYIPPHYTQEQVRNYVRYLDVVSATAYADHLGFPHAWVRWRMEETIRGINLDGASIGADYLNGQKTPIGIVQLFKLADAAIPTPEQTYHDFWQLIASGAQGIFVFSYFHRNDDRGILLPNWSRLQEAASQITGPEQLGSMVLYGTPLTGLSFDILDGPTQTARSRRPATPRAFSFPHFTSFLRIGTEPSTLSR